MGNYEKKVGKQMKKGSLPKRILALTGAGVLTLSLLFNATPAFAGVTGNSEPVESQYEAINVTVSKEDAISANQGNFQITGSEKDENNQTVAASFDTNTDAAEVTGIVKVNKDGKNTITITMPSSRVLSELKLTYQIPVEAEPSESGIPETENTPEPSASGTSETETTPETPDNTSEDSTGASSNTPEDPVVTAPDEPQYETGIVKNYVFDQNTVKPFAENSKLKGKLTKDDKIIYTLSLDELSELTNEATEGTEEKHIYQAGKTILNLSVKTADYSNESRFALSFGEEPKIEQLSEIKASDSDKDKLIIENKATDQSTAKYYVYGTEENADIRLQMSNTVDLNLNNEEINLEPSQNVTKDITLSKGENNLTLTSSTGRDTNYVIYYIQDNTAPNLVVKANQIDQNESSAAYTNKKDLVLSIEGDPESQSDNSVGAEMRDIQVSAKDTKGKKYSLDNGFTLTQGDASKEYSLTIDLSNVDGALTDIEVKLADKLGNPKTLALYKGSRELQDKNELQDKIDQGAAAFIYDGTAPEASLSKLTDNQNILMERDDQDNQNVIYNVYGTESTTKLKLDASDDESGIARIQKVVASDTGDITEGLAFDDGQCEVDIQPGINTITVYDKSLDLSTDGGFLTANQKKITVNYTLDQDSVFTSFEVDDKPASDDIIGWFRFVWNQIARYIGSGNTEIKVGAESNPSVNPSVIGVEKIQVIDAESGDVIDTVDANRDNTEDYITTATFNITPDQYNNGRNIKIRVTDKLGKETTKYPSEIKQDAANYYQANATSNTNYDPRIVVDTKKLDENQNVKKVGDTYWITSADQKVEFDYHFYDAAEGVSNGHGINKYDVVTTELGTNGSSEFKDTSDLVHHVDYTWSVAGDKTAEDGTITKGWIHNADSSKQEVKASVKTNTGHKAEATLPIGVDLKAPTATFTVTENDTNPVLRYLFGFYFKNQLSIDINASDNGGSGVQKVVVYVNGKERETFTGDNLELNGDNATAHFNYQTDKNFEEIKEISAVLTDNVGHESKQVILTADNTVARLGHSTTTGEGSNTRFIKDNLAPSFDMSFSRGDVQRQDVDGKTIIYVKNTQDEIDFQMNLSDKESGIQKFELSLDGQNLTKATAGANKDRAFDENFYAVLNRGNKFDGLKTDELGFSMKRTDLENKWLQAELTDLAGNKTTHNYYFVSVGAISEELEVSYNNGVAVTKHEASSTNAKDPNTDTKYDFGHLFTGTAKATISCEPANPNRGTMGASKVNYRLANCDGRVTKSGTIDVTNDKAEIDIPTNFRGNLYVQAEDVFGHKTKFYTTDAINSLSRDSFGKNSSATITTADSNKSVGSTKLYNQNQSVRLEVADTLSGVASVRYTVTSPFDTGNNQDSGWIASNQLAQYGWTTSTDRNLIIKAGRTINVSNNSNDIVLHVEMTDNHGYTKEQNQVISIDKTSPIVTASFDQNKESGYYNTARTATITVTERNFDASGLNALIKNDEGSAPSIGGWTSHYNANNPDQSYYTANVTFSEQGVYHMSLNATDIAGNQSGEYASETFTVDQTKPVIDVSFDNNAASNGNYFASGRTATITITEHNFDANAVQITGTATDNGATKSFPVVSSWKTTADTNTATIAFDGDGLYSFRVNATDRAGNTASEVDVPEFYVDQTIPEITIGNIEENHAYRDEVAPSVTISDTNFTENGVNITLQGANKGKVDYPMSVSNSGTQATYSFADFAHDADVDDIYTLTATATDQAGNEFESHISFSVNRFGSTYGLADGIQKMNGKYVRKPEDVIVTEYNVDPIVHDTIRLDMDKDGNVKTLKEGDQYSIAQSGGDGQWTRYEYTVPKSNFKSDGRYIISLYSQDTAGNINENTREDKKAVISFGVDTTAPVVNPINFEQNAQINANQLDAKVKVTDNLVLDDVTVKLDGKKVDSSNSNDTLGFQIPSSSSQHTVEIIARDAAGNETSQEVTGILVSTNALLRWFYNKPAFIGSVAGGGSAIAIGGYLLYAKKTEKFIFAVKDAAKTIKGGK